MVLGGSTFTTAYVSVTSRGDGKLIELFAVVVQGVTGIGDKLSWQGIPNGEFSLVSHQVIMTNVERFRRHIRESEICQVCKAASETIIHLLRDCPDGWYLEERVRLAYIVQYGGLVELEVGVSWKLGTGHCLGVIRWGGIMAGRVHAEHRYMLNSDGRTMGALSQEIGKSGLFTYIEKLTRQSEGFIVNLLTDGLANYAFFYS
ncbi:putative protein [Arabidopsis thaliana]|uniref:Uncharacterized protein T15B3_80 n=2 Tax=Arabidopsis thaliana TaxID=3702 RepID=Q9LXW5_ARATH|nr:uncharacterized protein AT3G43940 [Arabidopsis thaliana]AEE77847.1 hypothetical protein AT3G43940 [Arabidopsis thaliana]CAB88122.1 putative protein [Arabidopsis thaliana]VYS59256.1 unnamed protein product [Arabidopsis thaliana]|eukprot:NP_189980.1 hypothetical protein AT3G43940 [Arabidopsis thaliana]